MTGIDATATDSDSVAVAGRPSTRPSQTAGSFARSAGSRAQPGALRGRGGARARVPRSRARLRAVRRTGSSRTRRTRSTCRTGTPRRRGRTGSAPTTSAATSSAASSPAPRSRCAVSVAVGRHRVRGRGADRAVVGYIGGWVDNVVMRFVDAGLSFPPLVLALASPACSARASGTRRSRSAITMLPGFVRLVRGSALAVKHETYVEASRSIGVSTPWHPAPADPPEHPLAADRRRGRSRSAARCSPRRG